MRGENWALLAREKGHSIKMKKSLVRMERGHLLKEKGNYQI